jgi:hypothetical protein
MQAAAMITAQDVCHPASGTRSEPLGLRLLRRAAICAGAPCHAAAPRLLQRRAGETELDWLLAGGLGPMLYRMLTPDEADDLPSYWRDGLLSAELTARVQHAGMVDATVQLIDLCARSHVPLVLLKGISISEQHYPRGHLRPMGDIDVMVPQSCCDTLERQLLALGYRRQPGFEPDEWACHAAPLQHPEHAAWVELHTSVFPRNSPLCDNRLFSPPQLERELVSSTFAGRRVLRLTDEMQLVYAAAGWVRDMWGHDLHPSFLPPLFDAVYLIHTQKPALDWDKLMAMLDNEMAAASLCVMLSYLERHRLLGAQPSVLARLLGAQRLVQPVELALLHRMLDLHLLSAKPAFRLFQTWHVVANLITPGPPLWKVLRLPWNIAFPPGMAERYRLAYHRDRLARWWRAARGTRSRHGEAAGADD